MRADARVDRGDTGRAAAFTSLASAEMSGLTQGWNVLGIAQVEGLVLERILVGALAGVEAAPEASGRAAAFARGRAGRPRCVGQVRKLAGSGTTRSTLVGAVGRRDGLFSIWRQRVTLRWCWS